MFDAFHLPAGMAIDGWIEEGEGDAVRRVPALRVDHINAIAGSLRQARHALVRRAVDDIVGAIDGAAARLADPDDALRRTADRLLPGITGQAPAMTRAILDRMVQDWRRPALERLLLADLGDPAVLDGFARRPDGRRVHAVGPALTTHLLAGNVPGVGVTSVIRALLLKSAVLARPAALEPVLLPLFARALAEVDPELAACLAVTRWPRDAALDAAAIGAADTVIVYGGEEAVAAARRHARPGAAVVEHGPRVSFGFVCHESIATGREVERVAADVARATALFDQQGCVSPQVVYVEEGGIPPRAFAAAVAEALGRLGEELPRGPVSPAEAAAIHGLRASVEFRGIAGGDTEVFATTDTSATVLYEGDPTFEGSPLNRVLRVKPLTRLDALPDLVRPVGHLLQSAGYAGPDARIAALAPRLVEAGVTRITPFAALPFPPPFWHHDGRGPLAELLRWADLEDGPGGD